MMPTDGFHLVSRLAEIPAAAWDRLAGSQVCLSHAYLDTLEQTGCVGGRTGWTPRHATLWRSGELVAAMPLYIKQHSYGEYVFDWAWADAYQRHGLDYYPKWLCALPFTPIPGQRLLGRTADDRRGLLDKLLTLAADSGLSSLHILFPDEDEGQWMTDAGLLLRQGVQFHWQNAGYTGFEDFLAGLNHEKRKKIRQERRRAAEHGLTLRWLDGHSATAADWRFFHRCYATTYALHRSTPYLNEDFFTELARRLPTRVRLLLAERDGAALAGAFFLCDDKALYGRYWGSTASFPFLHFELCYYQAIAYCIEHGLDRFEGGAQGEHKLSRGLLPVLTRSAHWIADPRFRDAVDRYLARETEGIGFYLDELAERSPFRSPGGS
ncbi:GNAT family N-acetyltransferase [Azoarcus sp. DD4]|uniref:GNAT family N-acetyltransferase n=1 Tax=Azoarcus sp. DD4 TaxID=2027405 RepID=UPI00112E922D|nr:GNAT family N-acetyltransferase [Azoarcus sp. DD4]QDF96570.1 GNAT family N-acetyltransferase [Azoarcus sp. DD4]